jgi:hypothetical protein
MTLNDVEKNGLVAYKYVRGSALYGTMIEGSDIDTSGVYITPIDYVLGFDEYYDAQVSDDKHDNTYYEIKRWLQLLCQSNPNALESLFIPKDKIIGDVHPSIQVILDNRELFLTKQCFKSFYGYAVEQIKRARGLNKKIVNPVVEKKGVLDFCYVPHKQGSTKVMNWLANNGLKQKYCALVPVPNMRELYSLYYDFGTHIICEYGIDLRNDDELDKLAIKLQDEATMSEEDKLFVASLEKYCEYKNIYEIVPSGYSGIVSENSESNDVRYESIPIGKMPITYLSYNKDGYIKHCKDYREYKDWEKKRNPIRYQSNLNKNYDAKNMMHCVRLMHMAYEIASGQGFNVDRTDIDRDFLLDIRNHKFEYEYLINYLDEFKVKMEKAMEDSKLPDKVDIVKVNELLIKVRKEF